MSVVINGTTGITNDGGYTGDGVVFADTTPANTLVTTTGGNVGVGTASPAYKFQVNSGDNQLVVFNESGTWTANGGVVLADYYAATTLIAGVKISASTTTSGYLTFHTGGTTERARIDTSGNLLVGTTSIVARVSGVANSGVVAYFTNTAGTGVAMYPGNTGWSSVSDERKKDIIEPIVNASEKVLTLRAVIGKYKTDDDSKRRAFLIAQDVQAVLPEAVYQADDEDQTLSVQYTDTIPLLVAAIQEQQALIAEQSGIITALTARVAALEGTQP